MPETSSDTSAAQRQILYLQMRITELELEKRQIDGYPKAAISERVEGSSGNAMRRVLPAENAHPRIPAVAQSEGRQGSLASYSSSTPGNTATRSNTWPQSLDAAELNRESQGTTPHPPNHQYCHIQKPPSSSPQQPPRQDNEHSAASSPNIHTQHFHANQDTVFCNTPTRHLMSRSKLPTSQVQFSQHLGSSLCSNASFAQPEARPTPTARRPVPFPVYLTLYRQAHVEHAYRAPLRHYSEPSISAHPNTAECSSDHGAPPSYPAILTGRSSADQEASAVPENDARMTRTPSQHDGHFNHSVSHQWSSPQTATIVKEDRYVSDLKEQGQSLMIGFNKGWKWATATNTGDKNKIILEEPDYGPPPAIPSAWK